MPETGLRFIFDDDFLAVFVASPAQIFFFIQKYLKARCWQCGGDTLNHLCSDLRRMDDDTQLCIEIG